MTKDQAILEIARRHLRLETLATRNSDALDFSDQAVWSIKDALEATYEAGRASGRQRPAGQPTGNEIAAD